MNNQYDFNAIGATSSMTDAFSEGLGRPFSLKRVREQRAKRAAERAQRKEDAQAATNAAYVRELNAKRAYRTTLIVAGGVGLLWFLFQRK